MKASLVFFQQQGFEHGGGLGGLYLILPCWRLRLAAG
jgi:hypothetical protein